MEKNKVEKEIEGQKLTMEDNKMKIKIKGQLPRELFYKQHEELLKNAKKRMKDILDSCMVEALFVATVAFGAMLTVPGGNNSVLGLPIVSNKKLFYMSNMVSMISSAVALLMFLLVYTSREEDSLDLFPNIWLRGLIATIIIAFGTEIGLALQKRVQWAYTTITALACCPALIFTKLQLPLLFQTTLFASGPGIYRGQRDCKSWCLNKIGYRPLNSFNLQVTASFRKCLIRKIRL